MTIDQDKDLDDAIDEIVAETVKPSYIAKPTPMLKPVPPKAVTLSEQWAMKERIENELFQRIRREKIAIVAEHDRLWTEIKSDFERRIDFAVSKLEAERRQALQALADQTAEKMREHDFLMQRMERDLS